MYTLPNKSMDLLQTHLVDTPTMALISGTLMFKDREGSLKDQLEFMIRTSATFFVRVSNIWVCNLLQRILDKKKREGEFRLLKATSNHGRYELRCSEFLIKNRSDMIARNNLQLNLRMQFITPSSY